MVELSTGYGSGAKKKIVSSNLNLEADKGELIMLMGPNGSGKSTLIQTLAGLITAHSGELFILDKETRQIKFRDRAKLVSLVLTDKIDNPHLTVWDIVSTGRYPYLGQRGKLREEDKKIVSQSLQNCRLLGMEGRYYQELSDGEKQRVMIARALAQSTPLMILDEPTAHLDLPSRLEVFIMLRNLARQTNKTILISTHELELALSWADTIWLFDREGTVTSSAPEDLALSGDLQRVFGSKHLRYDQERGEFRLEQEGLKPIVFFSDGLERIWGERALTRMGYEIVSQYRKDIPLVEYTLNGWVLSYKEYRKNNTTLKELQKSLDDLGYHPNSKEITLKSVGNID